MVDEDEVERSARRSRARSRAASIVDPPSPSVPTTHRQLVADAGVVPDAAGDRGVVGAELDRARAARPRASRAPCAARCSRSRCRARAAGVARPGGPRASRISPFSSPTLIITLRFMQNSSMTRMTSSRSPGRALASTYSASASSRPSPTCQFLSQVASTEGHAQHGPAQEREAPAADLPDVSHQPPWKRTWSFSQSSSIRRSIGGELRTTITKVTSAASTITIISRRLGPWG